MSEENTGQRQPPKPITGVVYDWLEDDRPCQECGRLILKDQLVIRRNARANSTLKHILPMKYGLCLNCGADKLSTVSVAEYEKVLTQIQHYETLCEKKEITETEEKNMRLLERHIENLQAYVAELGDFVEYTENSNIAYYDDQLEDEEDE